VLKGCSFLLFTIVGLRFISKVLFTAEGVFALIYFEQGLKKVTLYGY